jgi:hypothetical protein
VKDILKQLLEELVDNPQDVEVNLQEIEDNIAFKIKVNAFDMGRIIGKSGRTISAIRSLMRIAYRNSGKRIQVDLVEPEVQPETNKSSA